MNKRRMRIRPLVDKAARRGKAAGEVRFDVLLGAQLRSFRRSAAPSNFLFSGPAKRSFPENNRFVADLRSSGRVSHDHRTNFGSTQGTSTVTFNATQSKSD